jgi:hypothetical protein
MASNTGSVKLNVLSRPKRNIHYKDFSQIDPELLKQYGSMTDESDDEEFLPSSGPDKLAELSDNIGDEDDEESEEASESDDDDETSESDEDDDDGENSEGGDENGTLNSQNGESSEGVHESNEQTLNSNYSIDSVKLNGKGKLRQACSNESSNISNGSKEDDVSVTENGKSVKKIKDRVIKTDKKKRKLNLSKRKLQAKNFEMDQETQKLFKSFKNSKIVPKKPKSTQGPGGKKSKKQNLSPESQLQKAPAATINTGPHVKIIKQKLQLDERNSIDYPFFVVKQYSSLINETNLANDSKANVARLNDMNGTALHSADFINKYKFLIPREKHFPVSRGAAAEVNNSDWVCSFCLNPANFSNGLGDLFGPYRVSADLESEIYVENQSDVINESRKSKPRTFFFY